MKTMVEDELMIKLGAKKETIEFHPLILAQRKERPKTSLTLDYRRVKPPFQEKPGPTRNPWGCSNQAVRQVSNTSRQGPRKLELPTLSPARHAIKRMSVPTEDEEYKKLRVLRLSKRDEILAEWSALQLQAFAVRRLSQLTLPDIEPLRKYSSASFSSIRSLQLKAPQQNGKKSKPSVVPFTYVPPTGKPKSRWRGMARQLLWNSKGAQLRLPEELPRSEVRIYVSCTQDLSEEREFLAEVAYPELRRFCEKKGLNCHVVDFRHGSDHLKNNRETFDLIDREIEKSRKSSIGPCFVSLVGREADDEELPGWLSKEDMLAIRSVLVKREDEAGVEALDNLYRLDSNYQPPIYLLEDQFFFAEREETVILHSLLPDVISQLRQEGKMSDNLGYYPWSSTVKEITAGLLTCVEPKRQTVCLMARATDDSSNDFKAHTGNPGADKLRSAIVDCYNRLGSKNNLVLFNTSNRKNVAYLREVCSIFLSAVTKVIDRQITHYEFDISHHLTNAADVVQHVIVARQSSVNFLGGENVVSGVQEMLSNPGKVKNLVIVGPEGSGRTALTSLIAAALSRVDPLRKIVFRVLGITLTSSSLLHLVKGIYIQMAFLYDLEPWLPADITLKEMLQAFRDLLQEVSERAAQKGPLTVVLDGVDKLPSVEPTHLGFLVGSIPLGTTLIMSMLNSGPLLDTVKSVAGTEIIQCQPFDAERTETYITSFLARRSRIVNRDQMKAIMRELSDSNIPLVARIAASMASRWPSHTLNDDLDISDDMESAFHRLLESCEVQLGLKFTRYVLSLLVASRYGLGESEIVHIISTDTDFINESKEEIEELSVLEGYPYQLQLSRILVRLDPFLYEVKSEGETILKVIHNTLRDVVHVRYLSDSFKYHIHKKLATYFQFTRRGHLLSSRDIVEGRHKDLCHYLWRTLRSVPYHLCHSEQDPEEAWKKLKAEVFMKFSWIINEIYAGFFNDFIEDLNYALNTLGLDADILFLRQFLGGVRQTVIHNPVSLASLLAGQDMKEMEEVQKSVTEAQEWLKQVHLQVLVPTAYTTQKPSQLQLNNALAKTVTAVVTDKSGERIIVQYDKFLTSLDHTSGEETPLTTFISPVRSTHLWGHGMMTVVTTNPSGQLVLDTYALDKGRHARSTTLTEPRIVWLQIRSDGIGFYATGSVIKRVLLEKGTVTEQFKMKEPVRDACVSEPKQTKAVTLHTEPRIMLHVFDSRQPEYQGTVLLQNKVISETHKPLSMTKDFAYTVVMCEREVLIVDLGSEKVTHSLTFNNVPVAITSFSRSHEHVFIVTPTRLIQCFKLNTGAMVMNTTLEKKQPLPADQLLKPPSPRGRQSLSPGRSKMSATPKQIKPQKPKVGIAEREELVTTLTTSEDDHFILVATTLGHVYILHVPTSLQVCVISTGDTSLRQLVYFSNASWFQHLVTVDYDGLVKLWNLRPLVSRARSLIMDIITDKDLLREEEVKLDLALYFSHFKERRNDRMFLNGPDVSAFYKKPPPPDLFVSVPGLDPALQTPSTWQSTGRLGDCADIRAVATGTDLSEVLVTATSQGELCRWSLTDGTLTWLIPCPTEGAIQSVRPVYYDQALCVVTKAAGDTYNTVTVIYPDETKKQSLVQKKVVKCHVRTDATKVTLVCTNQKKELLLVYWNLITGEEQRTVVLSEGDSTFSRHSSSLTFSNDLSTCAMLVPEDGEACTLYIWTITPQQEKGENDEEEPGSRETTPSSSRSGLKTPVPDFQRQQVRLQFTPTAIGFDADGILLLGTSFGLTMIVLRDNLKLTSVLTAEGVEPVYNQPLSVIGTWSHLAPPHASAVTRLVDMSDHVIVSSSSSALCVWNLLQKRLMLNVALNEEEVGTKYCHVKYIFPP
nr:hypothetical protein BaRGS_024604 [Batillaria attramentaria]